MELFTKIEGLTKKTKEAFKINGQHKKESGILSDSAARKIVASGYTTSMILGSVFAGAALMAFAVRDLHFVIEFNKSDKWNKAYSFDIKKFKLHSS
ncbi:hypothetical protein RCC89_05445 [Cytophagaceae bacterium ABcell3]|nr:hypothetical protein RCC89_05445 [Cytophagaceae bacterium ABcell3]